MIRFSALNGWNQNKYKKIKIHWFKASMTNDKTEFLPNSGCSTTTARMHHMNASETNGKKKLNWNNMRMLRGLLNKSSTRQRTKQQLYSHLPPIWQTMQVSRRHAENCKRSEDKLIRNVLLWTPTHDLANVGRTTMTYRY